MKGLKNANTGDILKHKASGNEWSITHILAERVYATNEQSSICPKITNAEYEIIKNKNFKKDVERLNLEFKSGKRGIKEI